MKALFQSVFCCVVTIFVLSGWISEVRGQARTDSYGSLTAAQLIAESHRVSETKDSETAAKGISKRAVELLLAPNGIAQYDQDTLNQLLKLAEPRVAHLSAEQRKQFEALVAQLPPAQASESLDELKLHVIALRAAGDPNATIPTLIENWVSARGLNSLSIEETEWCLRESLPNKSDRKQFSVTWTGFVTAPRSGNYVFSVSPINVNSLMGSSGTKQNISVKLGDRMIVEAGPAEQKPAPPRAKGAAPPTPPAPTDEWHWKGEPLALQAGQALPLRVELHYQTSAPSVASPPAAILCWEGPGIDRRAVEAEFLSLPDRTGQGLAAEYSFSDRKLVTTVKQISPAIDYTWRVPADVAPQKPQLTAQLSNRLWQLVTDHDYLARCAAGQVSHPYFQDDTSAEYLTSAQRKQFLQLLHDSPQLVERANKDELLRVYRNFRFGDPTAALNFVGRGLQAHADITPEITSQFFRENRQMFAELAYCLARQLPDQYRVLEGRYLEMPDGRSALPIAYTLSYSYRIQDQLAAMSEAETPPPKPAPVAAGQKPPAPPAPPASPSAAWLKRLTDKSDDKSLSEVARVNWILARAQAAEAGGVGSATVAAVRENYQAGLDYLTEAHLATNDPKLRGRIYLEEIARLVAMNQFEKANKVVAAAASVVSKEEAAAWQRKIDAIAAERQAQQLASKAAARDGYVHVLQDRRAAAVTRNDQQSVSRYDGILQAMHVDSQ